MHQLSGQDEQTVQKALFAVAPDLLAYFERRVVVREDAADLLNETLLQAWRGVAKLPTGQEPQRMWLFAIARNVLLNHNRSTRRRSALLDRIRNELATDCLEPDAAESQAIQDAVRRLPAMQRELVMLIHWDGFTITEAAQILGVNASTARSRYAVARRTLQNSLLGVSEGSTASARSTPSADDPSPQIS